MNHVRVLARARAFVLGSALALAALPAVAVGATVQPSADDDDRRRPITLTRHEVDASNQEIREAFGALVQMWRAEFMARGERFATPGLVRYRSAFRGPCGVVERGNAAYCPRSNTIYYDDVFVAAQGKRAAIELGTDGDMAAIGVIAHEVGHAAAIQLGFASRYTYPNEAVADCLAGAFTLQAERDGSLEPGDLEEAFYGMSTAGDPTPDLTGDPRIDRRIQLRAAAMGHGTRDQRMRNFQNGFRYGTDSCFERFGEIG